MNNCSVKKGMTVKSRHAYGAVPPKAGKVESRKISNSRIQQ